MSTFAVLDSAAIRFRYRVGDGSWFEFTDLDSGAVWDVSPYAVGVTEVQITHRGTSLSCGPDWKTSKAGKCAVGDRPFYLDDIAITP